MVSINEKYDAIFAPYEEQLRNIGKVSKHFTPVEK